MNQMNQMDQIWNENLFSKTKQRSSIQRELHRKLHGWARKFSKFLKGWRSLSFSWTFWLQIDDPPTGRCSQNSAFQENHVWNFHSATQEVSKCLCSNWNSSWLVGKGLACVFRKIFLATRSWIEPRNFNYNSKVEGCYFCEHLFVRYKYQKFRVQIEQFLNSEWIKGTVGFRTTS